MFDAYLPADKTIISANGKFRVKEVDEEYELWHFKSNSWQWLRTCERANDFRKTIGKVIRIE